MSCSLSYTAAALSENKALTQCAGRAVAQPAEAFVALRAVGRHAAVVAANTPVSVLVNLVDHRIRGFELAGRLHLVVNHLAGEYVKRRFVAQARYLDVTEAVVGKVGFPFELGIPGRDIGIGGFGRTRLAVNSEPSAGASRRSGR